MDIHWIAIGVILLIMAVLSAYRDALKNEPINCRGLGRHDARYSEEFE